VKTIPQRGWNRPAGILVDVPMRRRSKFTPELVLNIRRWVDQGLSDIDIARTIGCTVGTLKVRCSQFGISLRRNNGAAKHHKARTRRGRARPREKHVPAAANGTPHDRAAAATTGTFERIFVALPSTTFDQLMARAQSKRITGETLAATLLERIVADDLVEAVLDDDLATSSWRGHRSSE